MAPIELSFVDYCILGICILLILWRIPVLFKRISRKTRLRESAIVVLLFGYILYYIGFHTSGTPSSLIALIARSFTAALGLFVARSSFPELCAACKGSAVYMTFFGIIYILAICISAIYIVHFFKIRLLSTIRRGLWLLKKANPSTINIFFGLNNASVVLAKSIHEKGERIVFIEMPSEEDDKKVKVSLSDVFGLFSYKRKFINQLKGVRYVLMNADYNAANTTVANENFFDNIDAGAIRGFIRKSDSVRIFFLSDNENENIQSLINIQEDKVFTHLVNKRIDIYCHARRNETNMAFEKIEFNKDVGLSIHIVDSSYLAVRWLKQQPEFLPVNYVAPNKNGTVDTPFKAMLIGFGEIGQEVLSYIYEFGAFPDSNHQRSPFCCYVVDRKMNELRNDFYLKHPALLEHQEEVILTDSCDIKPKYDTWLRDNIKSVNYLVIAIGSDEGNTRMAIDLYELTLKNRSQMENFTIFVHISQQRQTMFLAKIMENYSIPCNNIVPFGELSEIFCYDNIILDEVYNNALRYNEIYEKAYMAFDKVRDEEKVITVTTQEPTMGKLFKNRRVENQNISNWLHAETKFRLLGLSGAIIQHLFNSDNLTDQERKIKEEIEAICYYSHSDMPDASEKFLYPKDLNGLSVGSIEEKMYNIALCEHLRWNAAHEMMGYTKGAKKSEIHKEHPCLDDWNNLPKFKHPYDMRDLDFLVLETSIKLMLNKLIF